MGARSGRGRGPVLTDPRRDAQLHGDGYAVVRLVPEAVARELRESFGALHGWQRQQLIDGQPPDFEIAMWNADLDYRSAVHRLVSEATGDALQRTFARHRTIGTSFMIKWPAEDGQPEHDGVPDAFHADSTWVDERAGTCTYAIWMPLQDVDDRNGCMQVVPHSHRLSHSLRGWGVDEPWLSHTDVYRQRARSVPLAAGEALVFHSALIHRTGANHTDQARVSASVLLAEPGVPLCIFRRRDDATAERIDVERTFFQTGDYADIAGREPEEIVALQLRDRTPASIARELDRHALARHVRRRALRYPSSS